MNILIISLSVNGAMGDNFKMLSNNLSRNNDISVITNYKMSKEKLGTDNVCLLHFDKKKPLDFINPKNYKRALDFIKATPYDVCFVVSPHPANLLLYKWLRQDRIVAYVHDHYHHSGIGLINLISQKANHYLYYKKSRKIIVACDFIKQDILKRGLMNDENKIEICELGLLDNLCFPVKKHKEDIDVLFFGRIKYYKGLDILAEAVSTMNNIRVVIAGKGDIWKECHLKGLPSNCEHLNQYVPDEKLAELIQRSKVVVLPYRDATGTQTIQSIFYYRKPIVATRVGCFPEYITNGKDGIIIEPENSRELASAISLLLSNCDMRNMFGEAGHEKLNSLFSNDRINRRYEEIFHSIM